MSKGSVRVTIRATIVSGLWGKGFTVQEVEVLVILDPSWVRACTFGLKGLWVLGFKVTQTAAMRSSTSSQ